MKIISKLLILSGCLTLIWRIHKRTLRNEEINYLSEDTLMRINRSRSWVDEHLDREWANDRTPH